jgi:hypothetical protein|eukprot:COSAG02_NODE_39_length_48074_cov_106.508890_3_plen_140_part_00
MVLARTALLVLFIVFVRCAACVCGVSLPGLMVDAAVQANLASVMARVVNIRISFNASKSANGCTLSTRRHHQTQTCEQHQHQELASVTGRPLTALNITTSHREDSRGPTLGQPPAGVVEIAASPEPASRSASRTAENQS